MNKNINQDNILTVGSLNVYYDVIHAVKDLSFELNRGAYMLLMGINGAGKTSTIKGILGFVKSESKTLIYNNQNLNNLSSIEILKLGIGYVPEGRHLCTNLTVYENILIAYKGHNVNAHNKVNQIFNMFPILEPLRHKKSGLLSGGEQQVVAIARGIVNDPELLILDEPLMGLSPLMKKNILDIIDSLHHKMTILIVEQGYEFIKDRIDTICLLSNGYVKFLGNKNSLDEMSVLNTYIS